MVRPSSTESFERIAHLRERIDIREGDLLDQLSLDAVYSGGMISYRFAHDVSVGTASITFRPWYGWDRGTGSVSGNAAATNGGNTTFGDGTTVPQLTAAFGGQLRALGTAAARAAVAAAPLAGGTGARFSPFDTSSGGTIGSTSSGGGGAASNQNGGAGAAGIKGVIIVEYTQ